MNTDAKGKGIDREYWHEKTRTSIKNTDVKKLCAYMVCIKVKNTLGHHYSTRKQ